MPSNQTSKHHRQLLYQRMKHCLITAELLNRRLVSYQANKELPFYRWFKYREGFSSELVSFFLEKFHSKTGKLLDPFAGVGTSLFTAQELGWESVGIEVMPVGIFAMTARQAANNVCAHELQKTADYILRKLPQTVADVIIQHIPITKDAFPPETEELLNRYVSLCSQIKDRTLQSIMQFAAFSILEDISFTRKDGQFLRWDYRSVRNLSGKPFDKGKIFTFEEALMGKIDVIINDLSSQTAPTLFPDNVSSSNKPPIQLLAGSCLEILPEMESDQFDFVMTSPPYCNRYDYTRTYALELVYLGIDFPGIKKLRQTLLSCTVENKDKREHIQSLYASLGKENDYQKIQNVYDTLPAMREVNTVLEHLNHQNLLNNKAVSKMVRNYFFEMCFVIAEMSRLMKKDGYCVMVNDNVRYGGEEIPVDLILSSFAEQLGFNVRQIYVLPQGKGNSSQQMGTYGREEIRKCVYLWQKQ